MQVSVNGASSSLRPSDLLQLWQQRATAGFDRSHLRARRVARYLPYLVVCSILLRSTVGY